MKLRPKFLIALLRNIFLKLRYRDRIDMDLFGVYIDFTTRIEILGGGRITFARGRRIYLDRGGVIRASGGVIKIGAGFFMNQNCMIVSHQSINIGGEVMLGPGVSIFDSDHATKLDEGAFSSQGYKKMPVDIGENVWLGANVVVTRGCRVGSNAVVAANSVARGDLQGGSVFAGVPAKRVRSLS